MEPAEELRSVGIPITTLIFRNYYVGVPTELVEAGRIENTPSSHPVAPAPGAARLT